MGRRHSVGRQCCWLLAVALLAFVSIASAEVPPCAEDGHVYNIDADDSTLGTVSARNGYTCPAGTQAWLDIVAEPQGPSLLAPAMGWQYAFQPNSDNGAAATPTFAVNARCGDAIVCHATITYSVAAAKPQDSSSSTPPPETTSTGAPSKVRCSHATGTVVDVRPGQTIEGDFPKDAISSATGCHAVILQEPTSGNMAVMMNYNPTGYIYAATPEDADTKMNVVYRIVCTEVTCEDTFTVWLHEVSAPCPNAQSVHKVRVGSTYTSQLATGASCAAGAQLTTAVRQWSGPGELTLNGLSFTYAAPSTENDATCIVRTYCDGEPLCDISMAFLVLTTLPDEGSSSSSGSGEESTTVEPSTSPPAIQKCARDFPYTVPVGQSIRGTVHVQLTGSETAEECVVTTYNLARNTTGSEGDMQLNLVGDFLYKAPQQEGVEFIGVNVYCVTSFVCRTNLVFTSFSPIEPNTTESPGTSSTPAPLPLCANVYYYGTPPGTALSSSLNDKPGQDACAHGRSFTLTVPPQTGTLDFMMSGDFLYTPSRQQGVDGFNFRMNCLGKAYCEGQAYITVSHEWTLPPQPTLTPSTKEPTVITNPQITCRGTCMEKAWKTFPRPPMWDNTPGAGNERKDGNPVDGLQVVWNKNALVFTVYTLIGNLGVRFPTFEPIRSVRNTFMEPANFAKSIASTSPAFDMRCLAHQGRAGMGEDVWKWTEVGYGTGKGTGGALYRRGQSWYQKFGGKHVECDTFADSCKYAPLLTPAAATPGGGRWSIDVSDCDATWTGVYPYNSLDSMKKADGSAVWEFVGDRQIKGTLISEAVRAHDWISPGQFDANYNAHDIVVSLNQFLVVSKSGDNKPLFSVDADFYTYVDEKGDEAFGINMLLYPFVTEAMTQSYSKDRHVIGYKWLEQSWEAPDAKQCPTCTGAKMRCEAFGQYASNTYKGAFPSGNCPDGVGRVTLKKGPSMSTSDCPKNDMHVYNQSGFSAPADCRTTYQNLTVRGVVPGSGALNQQQRRAFSFIGNVTLELLMADETKKTLKLQLSMYVSRLSQDLKAAGGGLLACRSGSYWPVLDPLGNSLPDAPFDLSVASAVPLCVDDLGTSFGPNDWAVFTLRLPGVRPESVTIRNVHLAYNNQRVYLQYKNPTTGAAAIPPADLGFWWQHSHPFLSYRELPRRPISASKLMANSEVVKDALHGFTFIPGAIGKDANVEVVVDAVIDESGSNGTVSVTTFRRMLHIDPLLTQLSRYGPAPDDRKAVTDNSRGDLYAIGAIAGVAVALFLTVLFYMVADNNRPLPKWVPRGKLIKKTVLSMLPPNMRNKKNKKAKRIVHRDMYDAMNSGKY